MDPLSSIFNVAAYAVPAAAALITGIAALKSSMFTNRQQQETLITRFGKHTRTVKDPGLGFKVPFLDKITSRVSTDRQQTDQTLQVKTKDNLFVNIPFAVQYQVEDTGKFYFGNKDAVAG